MTKKESGDADYGKQLANVVRKGYGATLRAFPSTAAFAKVYADPLSTRSARIPDFPVYPSTLIRLEQEFTISTGTTNYAWALFSPLNMILNDTFYPFAWFTNGSVVAPPSFQTTGAGVSSLQGVSPYSETYFDKTSQFGHSVRLVAWGFEVQNVSATLNMCGKYNANQSSPRLTNVLVNTDETNMLAYPTWKTMNAGSRKKFFYHRQITERADLRYNQFDTSAGWIYADDQSVSSEREAYMGLFVRATGFVSAESFIVRVAGHFEIIGQTRNVPGLGITKSDTGGLEKTVSAFAQKRLDNPTTEDHLSNKTEVQKEGIVHQLLDSAIDIAPVPKIAQNLAHTAGDFLASTF